MTEKDDPTANVLRWLYDRGEEKLSQLADDLLSNPRFAEALSGALDRALKTKGQVDRNMQAVLSLLNLPSKADYDRLLAKIETLQGNLVNLNIKIDRLLAERERLRRPQRRAEGEPAR